MSRRTRDGWSIDQGNRLLNIPQRRPAIDRDYTSAFLVRCLRLNPDEFRRLDARLANMPAGTAAVRKKGEPRIRRIKRMKESDVESGITSGCQDRWDAAERCHLVRTRLANFYPCHPSYPWFTFCRSPASCTRVFHIAVRFRHIVLARNRSLTYDSASVFTLLELPDSVLMEMTLP